MERQEGQPHGEDEGLCRVEFVSGVAHSLRKFRKSTPSVRHAVLFSA